MIGLIGEQDGTPAVRPVTGARPVRGGTFARDSKTRNTRSSAADVEEVPHARLRAALAHLLTFHTYGTWLPGDPRGTVRRGDRFGEPYRSGYDAPLARSTSLLR